MPLCPQITNTPITVTQTADFTVTSVVPLIADSSDGLASNFESIEILADGKTKVYRANDEPTGAGINDGDLWIDLNDGNKLYVRASGAWTSAQDASIGTAQTTANNAATAAGAAQSTANTALADAATAYATGVAAQNTANSASSAAATANAVGVAAQSTANTALANAATAYTAAIGSLQPSANTIVNANNQMTAINGTGITVYSGASATSGARVVLNSAGLAGFNSSSTGPGNGATFSISASTGAAVFSGSITGSTITGGTLNIGGNAIIDASGFLTATGATITGTITSNNITVTGGTLAIGTKFSVTNTGILTATDGIFTGTITSSNATITGGTLTVGANFSVGSTGVLVATGATITGTLNATAGYFGTVSNGFSIDATGLTGVGTGAITGGKIQTSSGTTAVTLDGSTTSMYFKYLGTVYGHILPASSGAVMIHYGATADPVGNSYPQFYVGASAISIAQSGSRYAIVDNSGLDVGGSITATLDITADRDLFTPNHTTVTDAANGRVTITLGRVTRSTASSERYKENITPLRAIDELDPKKLLDLPVRAFTYREDYLSETDSRFGALIPGFIAEEVDAIYPTAVDYEDGQVESWNDRMIIPGLLALIQDLYKEVQTLKGE